MPEPRHGWIRRSLAAVIEITGEDAADFLQSQFSADLRMDTGGWREGLWLNHRARIEGESCLLKLGPERFLLLSRSTPAERLMAKLDRHIISEEVELEDLTSAWDSVSIFAPPSSWIAWDGGDAEAGGEGVFLYQNNHYILAWHDREYALAAGEKASLDRLEASLHTSFLRQWSELEFKSHRIDRLEPLIPDEVGPEETPAEAGLAHLCSLQKGCYLGQEVVNRQSRLERVVKKLVRVRLSAPPESVAGEQRSMQVIDEEASRVGELRAWVEHSGSVSGLALLRTKALKRPLFLGSMSGPGLEVIDDE